MYGGLPNTGLNLSTPIYALIGLALVAAGGATLAWDKIRGRRA